MISNKFFRVNDMCSWANVWLKLLALAILTIVCGGHVCAEETATAQKALAARLAAAVGDNGYASYESFQKEVVVVIDHEADVVLKALSLVDKDARSSMKRIYFDSPCRDPESWRLLTAFESLASLRVSGIPWTRQLSETVSRMPALEELWAEHTGIDSADLRCISKAKGLRVLMVARNRFKGADLACLRDLKELVQLSLGDNKIQSKDLEFVQFLKRLKWLELADTEVDDEVIPFVSECKRLGILTATRTRITSKGVLELQKKLPAAIISAGGKEGPETVVLPPQSVAPKPK